MKKLIYLFLIVCMLMPIPAHAIGPYDCQKESNFRFCDDGNIYNGYWWYDGWVPGLPSYDSWFMIMPPLTIGDATWYAYGVMEATARYRGYDLEPYVGGVALTTCAHLGQPIWIKPLLREWEGPYLVVDCARQNDIYGQTQFRHEVVELDYQTAQRWMQEYWGWDSMWSFPSTIVSFVPPDLVRGDFCIWCPNSSINIEHTNYIVRWPRYWRQNLTYQDGPGSMQIVNDGFRWRLDGEWRFTPPYQIWYYEKEQFLLESILGG